MKEVTESKLSRNQTTAAAERPLKTDRYDQSSIVNRTLIHNGTEMVKQEQLPGARNTGGKPSRAGRFQNFFPKLPLERKEEQLVPEIHAETSEPRMDIPSDYPRLRAILRDRDLAFKPIFGQRDVAGILGKSDKTVRAWTRMGKLPCCWWPSGDPYYTPRNIEDFLARCERGGKATK